MCSVDVGPRMWRRINAGNYHIPPAQTELVWLELYFLDNTCQNYTVEIYHMALYYTDLRR